ncbi:dynamin family protein [Halomonas sp. 18H]|nr:dynamin family protein [Halomonas sp. 18H]MCW4153677.1 dynamin family protein [Halomonas sp. 18H]
MSELFGKEALEQLDQLASFWLLRRRKLVESLRDEMEKAGSYHQTVKEEIEELNAKAQADIATLEQHCDLLQENLERSGCEIERLDKELRKATAARDRLDQDLVLLSSEHASLEAKHELISRLLGAQPQENTGLIQFGKLLRHDFMGFANHESSLAEEASALLALQSVEKELELIAGFAGVHDKNVIAVAGGFSSGKSEFVNSFMQDPDFRLAVGLNPVTAIPAYVSGAKETCVQAYSKRGGTVRLSLNEFQALTHDFVRSFKFDLKTVMPYVSVGTRLGEDGFEHICFIDTPGYDPAATEGFTDGDRATALQYATQANAVFWLVGLDVNGTLPASDLEFLRELIAASQIEVFVVANKADLRSDEDIEDILSELESILDLEDISVEGISAYSSVRRQELSFRKKSLLEYLAKQNAVVEVQEQLIKQVENVFDQYREAIMIDMERSNRIRGGFRSMHLDILEAGEQKLFKRMQERFDELRGEFTTKDQEIAFKNADQLEHKMVVAVKDVFASIGRVQKTGMVAH